jgi:bifunctional DNA-binding transcriptional regulator/antitoxin component of YhaV-PrlF toxin-antitoxin module
MPYLQEFTNSDNMSESYEIRKISTQGNQVVIPHRFKNEMRITKGDYVKLPMQQNKVLMEKLEPT